MSFFMPAFRFLLPEQVLYINKLVYQNLKLQAYTFVNVSCIAKKVYINKSKKGGKDQYLKQSSTTPDPGYHMVK